LHRLAQPGFSPVFVSLKQPELLAKTYKAWLAQSVERLTLSIVYNSNQKAAGSSPASGFCITAWLAQSVERLTLSIVTNSNQKAAGSSPASGLIF
jgi:hypothetical protein